MKKLNKLIAAVMLSQCIVLVAYAVDKPIMLLAASDTVNLDQAVANIKKDKSKKVLSAESIQVEGNTVHVIKVLTDAGRIKKIRINSSPSQ